MMFYFRSNRGDNRRRMARAFIASAAFSMLAVGIMIMLGTRPTTFDPDTVTMLSVITVILMMLPAGLFVSVIRRGDRTSLRERRAARRNIPEAFEPDSDKSLEKQKNAAPGMDMYSLIDRMMEELDEDEIVYLQQKLEQRDEAQSPNLPQSIDELLNKRAEHRLGE